MTTRTFGQKFRNLGDSPVPWLLPIIIFMSALFVYPAIDVFRLGFTDTRIGTAEYTYTLDSFIFLLTDQFFLETMRTTLIFVFFSVVFQTLLGFVIALSVDKGEALNIRGTVFVRTACLTTLVIPGVVIGIIWGFILDEAPSSMLNHMLSMIGIGRMQFLSAPFNALVSVIVVNVWRGTAQSMILLYAGIKTVPSDILEAAMVDGAGAWRRLISMIIPSISPVIMITGLLNLINTFNTFDMIMTLTGGGPGRSTEVLSMNVYSQIFRHLNLGRGAAAAALLVVINIAIALVYFNMRKWQER